MAFEAACEEAERCNTDMKFFKGILHHSLATTMWLAPHTADTILPVLKSSAKAAVEHCTGGDSGRMCGFSWVADKFDASSAGAQTGVLSALVSVMTAAGGSSTSGNGTSNDGSTNTDSGSDSTTDDNSTTGGDADTPGSMGTKSGVNIGVTLAALIFGAFAYM